MSQHRKSIAEAVGSRPDKPWKSTLFQSPALLLGLNALDPGQVQDVHAHSGQDKFYLVHAGTGQFSVGAESFEAGVGSVVWAPAGLPHGVRNDSDARLVLVVGLAPAPATPQAPGRGRQQRVLT